MLHYKQRVSRLHESEWRALVDKNEDQVNGYYARVTQTLYSTAFSSVGMLQMAVDSGELHLIYDCVQFNAGRHGSVSVLLAAHEHGMPWSSAVVKGAARSGSIDKFNWVRTQYTSALPADIAAFAARSGSVDMLQLLQHDGALLTTETAVQAVEGGHLHILQFLYAEGCALNDSTIWCTAVERAEVAVFKWLHSIGCVQLGAHEAAALLSQSGNVDLMQCIWQPGVQLVDSLLETAVTQSHWAMCKYLLAQGCSWKPEYSTTAIARGQFDLVDCVMSQGVALTAEQQHRYDKCKLKMLRSSS
jgi:hypothetical protein